MPTIFQEQLERGGPLTVTDPSVRRRLILRRENEALADLDKHVLDLEIALRAIDSSAANPSSAA